MQIRRNPKNHFEEITSLLSDIQKTPAWVFFVCLINIIQFCTVFIIATYKPLCHLLPPDH